MDRLTRRTFIGGLGAVVAAPLNAELTGTPVRILTALETLNAWMKLAGALDDRLVIWWMDGVRYGVHESRAQALYGMKVGIFQRYFELPDNTWKLAMFELTYYTDLQTGKLLEQYRNPYTDEINNVRHVRLGPEIRQQTIEGTLPDPDDKAIQSMLKEYRSSLGPALVSGDKLWIPSSVEAIIGFPKPTAPDIRLSHYTTALGSLADAENPAVVSAPCSLAFQNVLKWEPWMNMRDHPGSMMSQAAGRKMEDPDQLPADYLAMAREVHPFLIKDPMDTLAAKVSEIQTPS